MGSWQAKCELSQLGISAGSQIAAVPLARGPYYADAHVDMIYNWFPVGPPVYGTYDDYGGIDLADDSEKEVLRRLLVAADTVMGDTSYEERDRVRENLRGLAYSNGCKLPEGTDYDYGGSNALAVTVGYGESVRREYPRWMFMHRNVYEFVRSFSPQFEAMLDAEGPEGRYQRYTALRNLLPATAIWEDALTPLETERIIALNELRMGMMNIHRSWVVTYTGPQFHDIEGILAFNDFVREFAPKTTYDYEG